MTNSAEKESNLKVKIEQTRTQLRIIRKQNLWRCIDLVREGFPEIFTDVEIFAQLTDHLKPWDRRIQHLASEAQNILEKYGMKYREFRHQEFRPSYYPNPKEIFCVASELLFERHLIELGDRYEVSQAMRALGFRGEELNQKIEEAMKERQSEWMPKETQ